MPNFDIGNRAIQRYQERIQNVSDKNAVKRITGVLQEEYRQPKKQEEKKSSCKTI